MFIPDYATSLAEATIPQIRLGIQGAGGTGKTWGALTFPNPIVASLDRGLGAHYGRKDVYELKFYDPKWVKEKLNKNYDGKNITLFQVIANWINGDARNLQSDQTLVFDGGTGINNAYHQWYANNKVYTKAGKEDEYAEYRLKIEMFTSLLEALKSLNCHLVWIMHETEQYKQGEATGKIRPLMSGQIQEQIMGHFTDWFRQLSGSYKQKEKITPDILKLWGMKSPDEYLEMQKQFPEEQGAIYCWQTASDDAFDGKCSSLVNFPKYLPASYKSFEKYRRKAETATLLV